MLAFLSSLPLSSKLSHSAFTPCSSNRSMTSAKPRSACTHPVPAVALASPYVPDLDTYTTLYERSITDPDSFWRDIAKSFVWKDNPGNESNEPVLNYSFTPGSAPGVNVSFLPNRKTNICYNAIDRWVEDPVKADAVAFYCEGNDPGRTRVVTFHELHDMVQRFANVLKNQLNVKKGDVVVLYMPMVPELPVAMLACARIGAIHSVVFGGYSAEALAGRILDSKAAVVVVTESVARASKTVKLKEISDHAIRIAAKSGHDVTYQIVTKTPGKLKVSPSAIEIPQDIEWDVALASADPVCPVEWVDSEHPLFVLYTSGSTGKPKGVVHATGGYMVYAATTFKYVFDYHENDVFFSTSDCGWITGHSYVTYGPLLNGATQVLYEGVPNYPTPARLWEIVEKYKVAQLYTAPTVIRALKGAKAPPPTETNPNPSSADWVNKCDRSSLRVLGSVGEPINPEAWLWYYDVVGEQKCAVVDTWWQTETGGHCLTPLPIPGLPIKPGCAMMPFFGIEPALVNGEGQELKGPAEGFLVIKNAWPSTLRTVYRNHKRMEETYFERFPGFYMTGDGARRDADGHYWLTGRVDDILNVSGHRIGTAEVESALVLHDAVAEAAVVGVPHDVKGEALYAYVSLMSGVEPTEELRKSIRACVRTEIGPFASPDTIQWAGALPKTRSGKIMRRILRKIAKNGPKTQRDDLGDTSTLTDPGVIDMLLSTYGK
ncbi:Acetyl-coenzyme A synthetase, cytoplasmic [Gracilariopsis chorda]|uniref:Acetyl-coenzyme A synthetase n=1 Tax=Gracilariopsis chorda TaxID=448386 RepID=A0A2V3IZK3_9FLOR|nr:Acetyl-coenzyme A synthetase, cytoplasmic [Gracilariopsis chorda]|eukprot:PXF47592.1 Acetyl-coenzyme A synthetase, cytoplasmic [Gracilariopsis chorda]